MLTDDPGTPGDGRWEINIAAAYEHAGAASEYALPVLDVNYGLGERIQLNFQLPWRVERARGQRTISGAGNGEMALKWRFFDDGEDGWQLSTYPRVDARVPLARSRLGSSGASWLLPLEAARKIGSFGINVEIGRWLAPASADDTWVAGLAVGREFGETLELVAELHDERAAHGAGDVLTANFGARRRLSSHCTLLASAGTDVHDSLGHRRSLLAYLGVQVNL